MNLLTVLRVLSRYFIVVDHRRNRTDAKIKLSSTARDIQGTSAILGRARARVVWDSETLRRRRRVDLAGVEVWIISPEEFIVSKLARSDRGVIDEQDVKSVLEREDVALDWSYLRGRAERAGVWAQLQMIRDV